MVGQEKGAVVRLAFSGKFNHDDFRSAPRRLHRRHGSSGKGFGRPHRYVPALQSRYCLQQVFGRTRSRELSRLVQAMGRGSAAGAQSRRFALSQRRRVTFESDAASRNNPAPSRFLRPAEHDPLDQGHHGGRRRRRGRFPRALQTDQLAALSKRLPRIRLPSHPGRADSDRSARARRAVCRQVEYHAVAAHRRKRPALPRQHLVCSLPDNQESRQTAAASRDISGRVGGEFHQAPRRRARADDARSVPRHWEFRGGCGAMWCAAVHRLRNR